MEWVRIDKVPHELWQAWRGRGGERITVGRLGDGRWYAEWAGDPEGACVEDADDAGKRAAIEMAERWMRESPGGWTAV